MAKYIIGVAPSRASETDDEGVAEPWCLSAASGRKVRTLVGDAPIIFANARDVFPGSYGAREIDRTPTKQEGYDLLCKISASSADELLTDVLLLGLTYWKEVADMAARLERLKFKRGRVPVGSSIPLLNEREVATARVFLLPHPRNWPQPEGYDQEGYRKHAIRSLGKQGYDSGDRPKRLMADSDFARVFSHFGF